jgi:hypothetical protein
VSLNPIVPSFIKKYIADYYSNTNTKYKYFTKNIEDNNYYFSVIPTPEQLVNLKNNFQNKSPYPDEIFLNQYMLNIRERIVDGVITTSYRFVLFLIGKVSPNNYNCPNILAADYLTATYFNIENIDINPLNYLSDPNPIILNNSNIIKYEPSDIIATENNQIYPNSLNYVKVRVSNPIISDNFPENMPHPVAIVYIKDYNSNLISAGGISLYNLNYLTDCENITGISLSVLNFINCLH